MRFLAATAGALALATGVLAFGAGTSSAPEATEPGELIVRFEPSATAAERRDARADAGTELERTLPVRGLQLLELEPGQSPAEAERELERSDGVLYAEPNVTRRAFVRPNDPYFSLLWAMENTGQSIRGVAGTPDADSDVLEAWDSAVGGGTVVAVADSGVDGAHPDLAANVVGGRDFVDGDGDPADENGHGTHVAGTIAAERGNGAGVAGVADGARIMPLRVLDADGFGRVSDLILAYSHAATNGARVVNLSLGSSAFSQAERDMIASLPELLFVAAAGNGGEDGVGDDNDVAPEYPCAYALPNVVCVGASDNRDGLADFSNFGAGSVDLAAPGVNIASTWPGGGYSWSSGTSMATPHVAGAAALLWAAAPEVSAAEIARYLLAGADASQAFVGRTVTGGRLNVLRSLRLVADVGLGSPAPVPPPSGAPDPAPQVGPAPSPTPQPSPLPGPEPIPAPAVPSTPPEALTPPDTAGPRPGVGDAVAPRLSIRAARRHRTAAVLRRGLAARVRCSEACTVRVTLRSRGRALTRVKRASLRPRAGRWITLRLTRPGRRLLARRPARTLALVGRATDRSGNRRTLRLTVRLSR